LVFDLSAQGLDSLAPEVETTVVYGSHEKDESGCSIEKVPGGYIICGKIKPLDSDSNDVYLIRTDVYLIRTRDLIFYTRWTKTFGGIGDDCAYSLQVTDDGGYIICGYTDSYGSGGTDVYLIKAGSMGDTLWTRTFGGTEDDRGCSVEITDDGGYIICGVTRSFGAVGSDIYLIKTDSSGDSLWSRSCTYQGYYSGGGNSVIETSDGGYVIGGWAMWIGSMARHCLLKTDSQGYPLWWNTNLSNYAGYLESVIETKNHDYVVTGVNWDGPFLVAKVNSSGDLVWSNKNFTEYDYYAGSSIRQTTDGGYIAVGTCKNYWGYDDSYNIFVVKIAPDEAGVSEHNIGEKDIILSCDPIVFSSITEIVYNVRSDNINVEIAIFDVNGERIKTIFRGARSEGQYITSWNGTSDDGNLLPNGIYFLRLVVGNRASDIVKLIILR
jgi:hypothetical protein